ncbi:hypothetical protein HYW60_02655 [Candidatus Kaiserbacteria bacterium]|nr:hypothetical protein [Candidatus Kaiserbacteria bacterium]
METKDSKMDDENGNCKQCGHPFDPHQIIANPKDLAAGGIMKCPVDGCPCFNTISFDFKKE